MNYNDCSIQFPSVLHQLFERWVFLEFIPTAKNGEIFNLLVGQHADYVAVLQHVVQADVRDFFAQLGAVSRIRTEYGAYVRRTVYLFQSF